MHGRTITMWGMILGVALGCSTEVSNPNGPPMGSADSAKLRVVHTIADVPAVDVLVGGATVLASLPYGEPSRFATVPAGSQVLAFRSVTSANPSPGTSLTFPANDSIVVLTVDSSSVINPWVLTDSGAVVPAGRSKLRAVHFAQNGPPLDVWRTQPDFQMFVTIMFPFPFRAVSPYLESDPGEWTVYVTTERRDPDGLPVLGDSLLRLPPINITDGTSRTVMILDRPGGGLQATIIQP